MTSSKERSAILVLASSSPRRKELLTALGVPFRVVPAEVDERPMTGESPVQIAERLAREKAAAVAARLEPSAVVLGADTVVAMSDGEVLGKPTDAEDAARMLRRLSGEEHFVHTGFAVVSREHELDVVHSVTTRVRFTRLTPEDIAAYVRTGEPMDKAGAYGIQGIGGMFVRSITGSYSNVVGLPLAEVREALREASLW